MTAEEHLKDEKQLQERQNIYLLHENTRFAEQINRSSGNEDELKELKARNHDLVKQIQALCSSNYSPRRPYNRASNVKGVQYGSDHGFLTTDAATEFPVPWTPPAASTPGWLPTFLDEIV